MEKIIQTLIDSWTKGVDTYTHNGSTWLIFTESKQWVIELTDAKTLWYNYNFFKQIFEFTSMDVVDNQQYITKWVENNIINKVEHTSQSLPRKCSSVEDIIQNGPIDSVRVNEYSLNYVSKQRGCEDTIENGVKETSHNATMFQSMKVEDTIQNGIKETRSEINITEGEVDDIIQDGVKHTEIGWHQCNNIDDAIENGVKETISTLRRTLLGVDDIIQNGVKETQFNSYENKSWIEGVIKKGVRHTLNTEYMPTSMVEDIIQSGVKHTEYGDWLDGDERLDDIIENGVKKTSLKRGTRPFMVKDTIKNGVKRSLPESFVDSSTIIDIIQNGVKETKTPGKDGDILSTIEWMEENKSTSYTKMINDILDNGEKINGTYSGGQRQSEKCKSVVEYGTKNPTD